MILADKILKLRKGLGLSQEELADKLNVSRQSISKWEGAQSIPDIERILALSDIFGVSSDYLMKDEFEEDPYSDRIALAPTDECIQVSLKEAQTFLSAKDEIRGPFASAVRLCIYSPCILLILMSAAASNAKILSEELSVAIGVAFVLIICAISVYRFIVINQRLKPFKYLEEEAINTEYGVSGIVNDKK